LASLSRDPEINGFLVRLARAPFVRGKDWSPEHDPENPSNFSK
jgi:hypothetical protein